MCHASLVRWDFSLNRTDAADSAVAPLHRFAGAPRPAPSVPETLSFGLSTFHKCSYVPWTLTCGIM